MSREELQQLGAAGVTLRMRAVIAHLPSGPREFTADQILEWNPSLPALAFRDDQGGVRQLHACPFEIVMEEARILRPA